MKKLSVLILSLGLALLLAAPVFAGEGSDTVGDGKLQPELRYSYMNTKLVPIFPLLNSGTYNLTTHDVYAQLNWGVHPNIDLIGLAGARFDALDADVLDIPLLGVNINADYGYSPNFLYGLGVKATFFRGANGFYMGGGVLFTHSFGGERSLDIDGTIGGGPFSLSAGKLKTSMFTLTPDIHAGWHFKNVHLTPYIGIEYRWAWAKAIYDIGQQIPIDGDIELNLEQEDSFGIFAGIDYYPTDNLYFNVEGSMLNRWGVSASVGYLFDIGGPSRPAVNSPFLGGGGAGSDTVGDCRLLPQLRYSFMTTELVTDFPLLNTGSYDLTMHDVYAQLNWGVHPNVDIIALAGARIGAMDADVLDLPILVGLNVNADYDYSANFLYGLGAKATFFRNDNGFYMGGGVLFTHSLGGERSFDIDGTIGGGPFSLEPGKIKTSMITLTPDIHAGWHFKNANLTPYIGLEYRWVWAKASYDIGQQIPIDGDIELNLRQDKGFGIYAGVDYYATDRLYFNVEGNMLNRWGVSASVGYQFDICEKPAPAPAPVPVIEPKLEPMTKN